MIFVCLNLIRLVKLLEWVSFFVNIVKVGYLFQERYGFWFNKF